MKPFQFLIGAVAATSIGAAAAAQTVSLGTNPQGSVAFAAGSAVSKVGVEEAGLQMRVVPQGGPDIVFPLVGVGELDFAIANGTVANFAYRGVEEFDRPFEELRFVAVLFPLYAGFVVRGSSDITSLSDLKGRRVPSEYLKQMTLVNSSNAVLSTVDMSLADVDGVSVPDGVRGVQDLEEGSIDATWFSTTAGRVMQAHAAIEGGVRVLPVEDTPENDAKLAAVAPGASVEMIAPGPRFPGLTEPIGSFTQPFVLVAGAHTSEETVFELVKVLHDNPEALATSFAGFRGFDPSKMKMDLGVPIHPGAARFYEEQGL